MNNKQITRALRIAAALAASEGENYSVYNHFRSIFISFFRKESMV
ncbi:MAG: hypothetical protein PQJ61_01035 [Spirochaetales bacterium]|uniref:Uncharacterized protein n=1 Tax=Candidatus Thalassospirochaeta sargassi TaxID=3119039 RepID=A0AAJ1I9W0_9SPIO|nr:hypothetical protein [Spirochaetales bacterium]